MLLPSFTITITVATAIFSVPTIINVSAIVIADMVEVVVLVVANEFLLLMLVQMCLVRFGCVEIQQ